LCSQSGTSFRNYPVQNRGERGCGCLPVVYTVTTISGKNTTTTGGKNTTIIGGKNRWAYRPFIASGHLLVRVLLPTASVEGGDVSSQLHRGHVQCTWSSSGEKRPHFCPAVLGSNPKILRSPSLRMPDFFSRISR
jgi:hypothetical protein